MPIAVPITKLMRYAGKKKSTKEWGEVRKWFERMTGTLIKGAIYRAKNKDYDDGFIGTVFSQVIMTGKPMRNGKPADTNYVFLSPWFLSNYYYRYTRPLDFAFYKRLRKPIVRHCVNGSIEPHSLPGTVVMGVVMTGHYGQTTPLNRFARKNPVRPGVGFPAAVRAL